MTAAPEMKYTDRDVREDPDLTSLAIAYLVNYTGEFEPLVDAKEAFEEDGELPTAVIRKVLNCMRHDAQVARDLPRPRYGSVVVAFRPPERRRRVNYDNQQCADEKSHGYHHWGNDNEHACEGVPYAINRYEKRLPVKVKAKYAASRSGKLIHDVAPEGHIGIWLPPAHEWGWRTDHRPYYSADAELVVNLMCRFPSVLRNPILIKEADLPDYMKIEDILHGLREMKMCPHCAKLRR